MSAASQIGKPPWKPRYNPWAIAIVVTLAAFMEILDTTIGNVSLPHIAGSLSASNDEATWTLTSNLVANAVVLTISGWLSEVIGRKSYFLICLAMFTVCSLLLGGSLTQIIIFRLLQGFFGGGLQPTQQSVILDKFPQQRRAVTFGVVAIATIYATVPRELERHETALFMMLRNLFGSIGISVYDHRAVTGPSILSFPMGKRSLLPFQ